jgi:hypothetical protein
VGAGGSDQVLLWMTESTMVKSRGAGIQSTPPAVKLAMPLCIHPE